jgi:hypothetical protein
VAREGGGRFALARGRPGTGARRGWPQRRWRAARVRRGGPAHRGKGQQTPYRRPGGEAWLQPSDARVPMPSSRWDKAGLGRRAGAGRDPGRTSGRCAAAGRWVWPRHVAGTGLNAPWSARP